METCYSTTAYLISCITTYIALLNKNNQHLIHISHVRTVALASTDDQTSNRTDIFHSDGLEQRTKSQHNDDLSMETYHVRGFQKQLIRHGWISFASRLKRAMFWISLPISQKCQLSNGSIQVEHLMTHQHSKK